MRPELVIVLMSGADHISSDDIDAYVSKPFSGQELAMAVREQLNRSGLRSQELGD